MGTGKWSFERVLTRRAKRTGNFVAVGGGRRTRQIRQLWQVQYVVEMRADRTPEKNRHILRYLSREAPARTTGKRWRRKSHGTLSLLPMPSYIIFTLSSVALASSIHGGWYQCSSGICPKWTGPDTRVDTRLGSRVPSQDRRTLGSSGKGKRAGAYDLNSSENSSLFRNTHG